MAISQSTTTLRNGQPQIELTVPYAVPPTPLGKSGSPFTNSLAASQAATGGSILGDTFHYYYFVAIDSDGKQGKPSTAIEVYVPAGTNTNTITLAGPTPFDVDAVNYEIYRSDGDPYSPFKIVSSTAVPSPGTDFTFTDTGISLTSTLMPDGMFTGVSLYWRVQGESGFKFAVKTIDRTQTSLKFAVPYNVQGKILEIQLRSLGPGGAEMNEDLATLSTYTVTGVLGAGINVGGVSREWQFYEGSGGVGMVKDITAAADRLRINSSGKVGLDGAPTTDWISVQGTSILDSTKVVAAPAIDFSRSYTNKDLDNIPDGTRAAWDSASMKTSAVDTSGNLKLKNISNIAAIGGSTLSTSFSVVPGLTSTVTTQGNKILILATLSILFNNAPPCNFAIFLDGVQLTNTIQAGGFSGLYETVALSYVHTPAAGSHTYDVRWSVTPGGQMQTLALPSLQVVELG